MGEGKLLAGGNTLTASLLLLPALLAAVSAPAQGPVYRERWGYLHLENRRAEVLRELAGRDAATRTQVAELLLQPDQGVPFTPVAKALARLRGVVADDAFLLRAAVSVFLLPEVVDPVGQNETCRQANISVYLPFTMRSPGELSFEVDVRDGAGARKWSTTLATETRIEDLRTARPVAQVPCGELGDGTYEVVVRTFVGGVAPAPADPVLRWPFHVRRGYQAQCEAALVRAVDVAAGQPELPRAMLLGMASQVRRAYAGEAFEGASDALRDLDRLELALQNLALGKHLLAGMAGDVPTALPTSQELGMACVLRLDAARAFGGDQTPRPLVVFAGGCPAYDLQARRPTAPTTRGGIWLARELPTFGVAEGWHVAFLDSPGGGRNYGKEVLDAVGALRRLLPVGDQPVVLVCDREAAAVVSFRTADFRPLVTGLVLVGAGAMPGPTLDALGAWPVRVGMLHGHPGAAGLQRSLDYVALRRREGTWQGDYELLASDRPAWFFGLAGFAEPVREFVAGLARR